MNPDKKPKKKRASKKNLPSLSTAEWEVMKPLWKKGPMAARDVFAALPDGHGWAYKTVKTLLSRLVGKKAINYKQIGNSYLYRPTHNRNDMTRTEASRFLNRIGDETSRPAIEKVIEESNFSEEDINTLQRLLEVKQQQAKKNR